MNVGGVNSGPFTSTVLVKLNGVLYDTWSFNVPDVSPFGGTYGFSHSFQNPPVGNYTFDVYHDNPNMVTEVSETNNQASYALTILACKPSFSLDFCSFDVNSSNYKYTTGSNATVQTILYNGGNLPYSGPLTIRYSLSNGTTYDDILTVNLPAYGSMPLSYTLPVPAAMPSLTIIADPNNLIDELNESDNSVQNTMCWEYQPVMPYCGGQILWHPYGFNGSINQEAYITVPYISTHLYDADTLHMLYEVSGPGISGWMNLGTAEAHNVEMTCSCPYGITLPTTFVFSYTGTYTFRIVMENVMNRIT
jgi:hypothetical protein